MNVRIIAAFIISCFITHALQADDEVFYPVIENSTINAFHSSPEPWKSLIGDTIHFKFSDQNQKGVSGFYYLTPDTLWLKKRPKKDPKEGKHYRLIHNYKGVDFPINKKESVTLTPIEAFKDGFVVENYMHDLYPFDVKLLFLRPLSDSTLIKWQIPQSPTESVYGIVSNKISKELSQLYWLQCYISGEPKEKSDLKDYLPYKCKKADVTINSSNCFVPIVKLQLADNENSRVIVYNPYKGCEGDIISHDNYISQVNERLRQDSIANERRLEKIRVYTIDTSVKPEAADYKFPFDFVSIMGKANGTASAYYKLDPNASHNYTTFNDNIVVLIGDKITVRDKDYYKASAGGKVFYVPCSDITLSEKEEAKLSQLLSEDEEVRNLFFEYTKALGVALYSKELEKIKKKIEELGKQGLSIIDWGYVGEEYSITTGAEFTFYNPTKYVIKYITINLTAYNAVDDPIYDYGDKSKTVRCIGPIEPGNSVEYSFDNIWFIDPDYVDYLKINYITVEYKNGPTKTIKKIDSIEWPEGLLEDIQNPPLKDLEQ